MNEHRFRLPIAAHLFLLRNDQVLLLRRFNTGYEDGNYSVIAGHLDGDEEIKTAMIREAQEEAGITIPADNLEIVGVMHRQSDEERIDFFLTATSWVGKVINNEPDKCDELLWCEINALPQNVIPYIAKALDNYHKEKWFDSFGWE